MRSRLLLLLMLLCVAPVASAQVNIGINFSLFPDLVRVPNYPVYYAPRQNANYFFYDGLYWVYQNDDWYSSDWYNGPWWRAPPEYVPEYVLRVPVRYYRRPPAYFRGWGRDAPPRWGEHWGRDWEQRRSGWDRWDRRAAPAPAPLPTYQRQYSGNRYPRPEERHALHDQKYRYQPKDALVREHVRPQMQAAPAPSGRDRNLEPQRRDSRERDQRPGPSNNTPGRQAEPAVQHQQPPAVRERQAEPQRKDYRQDAREREQRPPPQAAPPREPVGEPNRGKGPEKGREKGEERGHESNK